MRNANQNALICSIACQWLLAACGSTVVERDPASLDMASDQDAAAEGDTGTPEQADAQSSWPCTGAGGMTLSCDSLRARPLTVSHFNAERGCFEPATTLEGLCGVPTYCPSGSGEIICVVGPDGSVYLAHVLFGEELTDGWHHSGGVVLDPALTADEEARCAQIGDAMSDAGSQEPIVLGTSIVDGVHQVRPACNLE